MRRPLVAANWKMHGDGVLVDTMVAALADIAGGDLDILLCPPFVHLARMHEKRRGSALLLGAQNLHAEAQGAFTGEISAGMLVEAGCSHVIVGHSERRQLFGENDEMVARKFRAAVTVGLVPVLCVGETAAQRQRDETADVVGRQLRAVLDLCGIEAFDGAVVAYEPVWAIGTGETATPQQAQAVHALIRERFAALDAARARALPILYGGSVKADNAASLFAQEDVDGALVGGASLVVDDFVDICRAARRLEQS